METNNWAQYLQDTRNDMANHLLKPIETTLNNSSLSAEEQNKEIKEIINNIHKIMDGWDVKQYGIVIP